MLKIINYNCDEYEFPCLIVLGCFDAIHAGHAELLKKAKLQAKINGLDLGVMIFSEGKCGKQVFTFEEKLQLLEDYNVKFVLKIDFNDEFKKTKPLEFLQNIEEKVNVKAYMSGKDFRFGEGAKGKSSTLKNYAEDEENGVWYMPIKDVLLDSEKISTTSIKKFLEEGNVKKASEFLGRNFSVCSEVINGADRGGKTIGFPTINLRYPEDKTELKFGVYSVKCLFDDAEYIGMANYGSRPTFGENEPLLEVYLNDFGGDLYGKQVKVEFIDFIRDIHKFENSDELKEQLLHDLSVIKGTADAETAVVDYESETQPEKVIENVSPDISNETPPVVENCGETYSGSECVEEAVSEIDSETVIEENKENSSDKNTETTENFSAPSEEELENDMFETYDDGGFDDDYIEDIEETRESIGETLVETAEVDPSVDLIESDNEVVKESELTENLENSSGENKTEEEPLE